MACAHMHVKPRVGTVQYYRDRDRHTGTGTVCARREDACVSSIRMNKNRSRQRVTDTKCKISERDRLWSARRPSGAWFVELICY